MADLTGAWIEHPSRWSVALPVTSARDGLEHLVADEAMTGNAGRYVALCGRAVWAASLACPAGRSCQSCVAAHTSDAASRRRYPAGLWAWLNPIRCRRHRASEATAFPDVALPVCEPESSLPAQGLVLPPPVHRRRPR